jgi:hypothetical protein
VLELGAFSGHNGIMKTLAFLMFLSSKVLRFMTDITNQQVREAQNNVLWVNFFAFHCHLKIYGSSFSLLEATPYDNFGSMWC